MVCRNAIRAFVLFSVFAFFSGCGQSRIVPKLAGFSEDPPSVKMSVSHHKKISRKKYRRIDWEAADHTAEVTCLNMGYASVKPLAIDRTSKSSLSRKYVCLNGTNKVAKSESKSESESESKSESESE